MAISSVEMDDLNARLKQVADMFGGLQKAQESFKLAVEANKNNLMKSSDVQRAHTKLVSENRERLSRLKDEYKKGEVSAAAVTAKFNEMRQQMYEAAAGNAELQAKIKSETEILQKKLESDLKYLPLLNKLQVVTGGVGTVLGNLGGAAKGLVEAYQGGASDLKMAGSALELGLGAATKTGETLGKGLSSAGSGLKDFGGAMPKYGKYAKVAGAGLEILGGVVGGASKGLSNLAKETLPMLQKQLEMYYDNFVTVNHSGAMFSDGITGMVKAAGQANLLLPEFADVVKNQSAELAASGGGVALGVQQLGRVGQSLKSSGLSDQLIKLGVGYKEQASTVVDVMAIMRQSGSRLTSSDDVIAQNTAKYAENLKIISAVTGEDAKKKEAQVRDEANKLAFQQKLQGMDETQRLNVISAMENMSDAQRKAFEEVVVFGNAVTPASAAMMSQVDGFGASVNQTVAQFQAGTLDATSMQKTNAEYGEQIKASMLSNTAIAQAGMAGIGGLAGQLEEAMNKELKFRNVVTDEAIKGAQQLVQDQKNTTDNLTKSVTGAVEAGRVMSQKIQEAILDSKVIDSYADALKLSTSVITEGITAFSNEFLKDKNGKPVASAGDGKGSTAELVGEVGGGAVGAVLGSFLDPFLGPFGTILGEQAGQYVGGAIGRAISTMPATSSFQNDESGYGFGSGVAMAAGGVASGPKSGYPATLHGREAVVPLPDGFNLDEMSNTNSLMSKMLSDPDYNPAMAMEKTNPISGSTSEDLLGMLNDKMSDLLDVMSDVSRYTKATSVNVA
jgi:hypothetical protein